MVGSVETSSLRWATGHPTVQPKHTDSSKEVVSTLPLLGLGPGFGRRHRTPSVGHADVRDDRPTHLLVTVAASQRDDAAHHG